MPSRPRFHRFFNIVLSIGVALFFKVGLSLAATDEGMEILTRGPVHEGFADVVDEAQPSAVTSHSVPEPVNEIPPDYRPEGANIQWISGYWSWDDDQNDFIWVSGIWRDVPPGRQWIPGYWMAVEGGNQYISGFWTDVEQTETVYLPPPPQPLQVAPSAPASSPDYIWVDGSWLWYNDRYAWQPGYWRQPQPDMVWVPAHYVWTPRGYIFARGYWDYQLSRRGVMFAPRYYARPIYRSPDYYYTPSIILDTNIVFLSLFIRRDHRHYYFGDYYDNRYERRGFTPWYSKHATRHGYDPGYKSYRRHNLRLDKQWEQNYQRQYQHRRDHKEARPAVIYNTQVNINIDKSHRQKNMIIGRRLTDAVEKRDQPLRFTRLSPDRKRDFQARDRKLTTYQVERRTVEMGQDKNGRASKTADVRKAEKVNVYASPINDYSGSENFSQRRHRENQDNRRSKSTDKAVVRPQGVKVGKQAIQRESQPGVQYQDVQPKKQFRQRENRADEQSQLNQPSSQSLRSGSQNAGKPQFNSQRKQAVTTQPDQTGRVIQEIPRWKKSKKPEDQRND
jgi:hypothetical protein